MFCPPRLFRSGDTTPHRTAARRDVPGSRLLLTDRVATLRSGSPPGVRPAQPAAGLQRSLFLSHPSSAPAFLGCSSSSSKVCERPTTRAARDLAKFIAMPGNAPPNAGKMRHSNREHEHDPRTACCAVGFAKAGLRFRAVSALGQ
jgi:hypothetical protein